MTLLSSTILPFIKKLLFILPGFDFHMISFRICQVFFRLNLLFSSNYATDSAEKQMEWHRKQLGLFSLNIKYKGMSEQI